MPQSKVTSLNHVVFGTDGRRDCLNPELQKALWAYIGGIARNMRAKAMAVGGTGNHVHILLSLPANLHVADAVQRIKGSSSKWISDNNPEMANFRWQRGYGSFTISSSGIKPTIRYIQNQEEKHRKKTFMEEYNEFLIANGHEPEDD